MQEDAGSDLWKRHGECSNYPLHEAVLYCDETLVLYIIKHMQHILEQWRKKPSAIANIKNKYVLSLCIYVSFIDSADIVA
jgi:hypothetical protein